MTVPSTFSADWASELTVHWTRAQPIVAAFIAASVRDYHDAEDLLQDVAEAVARNFASYDRNAPFTGWAIGIARHKLADYFRRHHKDPHVFDDELLREIAEAYKSIESESDDIRQALRHCMSRLRGRARKVLDLRYKRELAAAAVAGKLGITVNATYILLSRVRAALGKCIDERMTAAGGDS